MAVKHSALSDHPLLPSAAGVAPTAAASNNADMANTARAGWRAIGERVAQLRRSRGWNRTTLAARARVTVTTIRGCEDATRVTQPDKLRAIAKALGVPVQRLEVDDKDPRVKHWTEEDYEIGNWYHNAPRALKNRLWALQEMTDVGQALTDPQFARVLETWASLTQDQKVIVLNALDLILHKRPATTGSGGVDAVSPFDPKARGPQR